MGDSPNMASHSGLNTKNTKNAKKIDGLQKNSNYLFL